MLRGETQPDSDRCQARVLQLDFSFSSSGSRSPIHDNSNDPVNGLSMFSRHAWKEESKVQIPERKQSACEAMGKATGLRRVRRFENLEERSGRLSSSRGTSPNSSQASDVFQFMRALPGLLPRIDSGEGLLYP